MGVIVLIPVPLDALIWTKVSSTVDTSVPLQIRWSHSALFQASFQMSPAMCYVSQGLQAPALRSTEWISSAGDEM